MPPSNPRDVPTTDETCPICQGHLAPHLADVTDPLTGELFAIRSCRACGLGVTTPQPGDLAPYYGTAYYGKRHGFTADYCIRRRMRWVNRFPRGRGRLLDIGCGDGSFLSRASRLGWQVTGTEMDPSAARAAGLRVGSSLADIRDAAPFDIITMWHSLEHIPDPLRLIAEVAELLAPEGTLLIAVPDFGGWQSRLTGRTWLHADVPRHLLHYTSAALGSLLKSSGFQMHHRWHCEFEYDLLGWSQSIMNRFLQPQNAFFDLLRGKRNRRGGEAILQLGVGITLSVLALPLVPLGAAAGRGGTLVVAARR